MGLKQQVAPLRPSLRRAHPVEGSDNRRFFAVLHAPPITSPVEPVRTAILATIKENRGMTDGGDALARVTAVAGRVGRARTQLDQLNARDGASNPALMAAMQIYALHGRSGVGWCLPIGTTVLA